MLADIARPGHANQAIGTAEALGLPFDLKPLQWGPLARLPNALLGGSLAGLTPSSAERLALPWPDLVIAAGRRTAPVARWLRARSGCRCAQLMWPGSSAGLDLVIVPVHDRAAGRSDVSTIRAAPHRLTPGKLADAAATLAQELESLPRPWLACLVGGARAGVRFGVDEAALLAQQASRLAEGVGGSLLVVTSRRTGEAMGRVLRSALSVPHRIFAPDTPFEVYAGVLGMADELIVTADSASMLAEACAVGRPVRLFRPPQWRLGKLDRLHAALAGWLRPLDAPVRPESLPRLDSGGEAAALVRRLLDDPAPSPHMWRRGAH